MAEPSSELPSKPVEPTPDEAVVPTEDQSASEKPAAPRRKHRKLIVAVIVLLVAAVAGGGYWWHSHTKKTTTASTTSASNATSPSPSTAKVLDLRGKDRTINGRTWLANPVKTTDYNFFKDINAYITSLTDSYVDRSTVPQVTAQLKAEVNYYKVGKTADGKDILRVTIPQDGPSLGLPNGLYVADSTNAATLLLKHSLYMEDYSKPVHDGPALLASIKIDSTTTFPELVAPAQLTYGSSKLSLVEGSTSSISLRVNKPESDTSKSTFLESNDLGNLNLQVRTSADDWSIQQYQVETLDGQYVDYQDSAPTVKTGSLTFDAGGSNTHDFGTYSGGCGSGSYNTVVTKDPAHLQPVAKDASGRSYYIFYGLDGTNLSDPLFVKFYSESQAFWQGDASHVFPKTTTAFANRYPILLVRNQAKQLTALFNSDLAPAGGCAKPVVYLYPTAPTSVSISVDADVTKSVPAYHDGWTALAQPSGQLTVNGQSYDSLFWEGYGHGLYPEILGRGTVVTQSQLVQTVTQQLGQLGLNGRERADFLAFWQSRLPKDPYVRLTWLGTTDMNRLAPLHVTPAPDTTIRVFLDAEGLSAPKHLQPQQLTSPVRRGFTLVEWGGLLRGKLN